MYLVLLAAKAQVATLTSSKGRSILFMVVFLSERIDSERIDKDPFGAAG
jgi:hypothetical protein